MGTPVNFNGSSYTVPANGERAWGTNTRNLLIALAGNALSKAGGNFTLTADVNFGSTYGLVVKYLKSVSSNIATSGVLRLANTDKIAFRNNANGADLELGVSTSDRLQFGGVNVPTVSTTDTFTNKTVVVASNTITTAATGNLAATELNAALAELQTDIDTRATSAAPVITGGATVRGTLLLQNTSGAQPELHLSEDPDNGTNKVAIKAPASLSGDYTLTLPSDDGGANQVLQTDGSGGLSWTTVASTATTTEGDIIYRGASADQRLAGNTSAEPAYLRQTGTGSASAAPVWQKASGLTRIRLDTVTGYGSTNTAIRRFTNTIVNTGTGITYADSASNGATFTVGVAGVYSITYWDQFSAAADFGLSVNSNQLTTAIISITASHRLVTQKSQAVNATNAVSYTGYFAAGDVIRAHADATTNGSVMGRTGIQIQRIT
jgi:hypothetical protein